MLTSNCMCRTYTVLVSIGSTHTKYICKQKVRKKGGGPTGPCHERLWDEVESCEQ